MNIEQAKTRALQFLTELFIELPEDAPEILKTLQPANAALITSQDFQTAPAAKSHHHNYPGGLIIHTAEVVIGAIRIFDSLTMGHEGEDTSFGIVACAALWHDATKTSEYSFMGRNDEGEYLYEKTDYANLIGHVAGSYASLLYAMGILGIALPETTMNLLGHAMLAHHDRLEYGSPVEPNHFFAHVVHAADIISCSIGYIRENYETLHSLYETEDLTSQ